MKASASEALGVYPVMREWVANVVIKCTTHVDACKSFLALCALLDLLVIILHGNKDGITGEQLHKAVERHFLLFLAVYGEDAVIPKHHFCMHFGAYLDRWLTLIGTFYTSGNTK